MVLVALVEDLFFAMRILELSNQAGVPAKVASTPDEFLAWLGTENPDFVLVDLRQATEAILKALTEVPHVAGFGPHVDRERFQAARAGGIKTVWANSALDQKLPGWLRGADPSS